MGGIYSYSLNTVKRVYLDGGTAANPVIYESYPGQTAIFDGSALRRTVDAERKEGRLRLTGEYATLRNVVVRKYPTGNGMYEAIEKAVRKFISECNTKGYPELVFCPIDEPRAHSAEFAAKIFSAFKRAGARTYITNDPTFGYSHHYRKYQSIDAWCSQAFALPYEKVVADHRHEYWSYPNHNACELKDRVIMQKGGRMTYGYGLWRSGYTTLMPWAWRWYPGGKQFGYLSHARISGTGNRLDENANFIPAIYWECFREGIDDGRYLYTLEQTLEERRDSKDPDCQRLVDRGDALLNNIWGRILPEKKYLRTDFLADRSFKIIRWEIAELTTRLKRYEGSEGVVAPSVVGVKDVEFSSVENEEFYVQKGIEKNIITRTSLAVGAFKGWEATADKELSILDS